MTATSLASDVSPRALYARLLDDPELPARIQALPAAAFAALIHERGLEDAGELVALATVEQLVSAFDEDLFAGAAPGEREVFDRERFVTWLEVLLEAGDRALAARLAAMSEDFVAQALSSLLLVCEPDVLRARVEDDDDGPAIDKLLEAAPCEELDGHVVIGRDQLGWDAALAAILALDRDHRAFLVRVLDRCVEATERQISEHDGLYALLTAAEQLAEDVEAEREERRAALGHVEPRAARAFLALARRPLAGPAAGVEQDPITRAYFREQPRRADATLAPAVAAGAAPLGPLALPAGEPVADERPLAAALRHLAASDPAAAVARRDELVYLANVIVAGAVPDRDRASTGGSGPARWRPADALEAVLATVTFGALLELGVPTAGPAALAGLLRRAGADRLFRRASAALPASHGFVRSWSHLADLVATPR